MGECGKLVLESGVIGMFMGEYQHSIDNKGTSDRTCEISGQTWSTTLCLHEVLDRCLFGYPMDEWHAT